MHMPAIDRTITSVSTTITPFGCCNFFDRCTDEIMSLHWAGQLPLLDWMGFNVSDECYRSVEFIAYLRAERGGLSGHIANPCDDPNSWEYCTCKLTVEDFGRYGREGPTREIMKPKLYCKTDPIRRLDGSLVSDEREWDMRFTTDMIIQDISGDLIVGNHTTTGQFDGLEQWVKTGYDCTGLDSVIINWNGNPMSGGNGITWNGAAIANTFDFVDVLLAAFRRIKQRISWSKQLANQRPRIGDMILLLPTNMAHCLLDFYTCWSVCAGAQYNEANLNTYEARTFRDRLIAESPENMFGFGYIRLDGMVIPLLAYDWELIKGPLTGDIYLLTGAWGGMRLWEGEHLSAAAAVANFGGNGYWMTDGGRMLWVAETQNECYKVKAWMHPRLFCKAPWAQVRFQSVRCATPGGPLSPDPEETSFFPETSCSVATC
jgi:hypothetical protein